MKASAHVLKVQDFILGLLMLSALGTILHVAYGSNTMIHSCMLLPARRSDTIHSCMLLPPGLGSKP